MRKSNRRTSVDDLVKITADLIDHVKVLVAAVDDLRCEVEWWARNATDQWTPEGVGAGYGNVAHANAASSAFERNTESHDEDELSAAVECNDVALTEVPQDAGVCGLSAEARLSALESSLKSGPPGAWPDDADESDPPELPTGCIVEVDEELWASVIDMRPAHVVRMGCCCEEGIGAPYLLAWEAENGYFLRELTEAEAIALQQACLAAQDEAKTAAAPIAPAEPATTQLGLWQE